MYKNTKRVLAAAVATVLLFSGNVVARAQTQDSNPSQAVTEGQAQDILAQRRDLAEQHMRSICSMLWRADEDILYTRSPSTLPEDADANGIHIVKGRVYQGMAYSYSGSSMESWMEFATGTDENGVITISGLNWQMLSGGNTAARYGTDCSGAVCQSWAQFGTSANVAVTAGMTTKNGYLRVGDYTSSDSRNTNTSEVTAANGEQVMYAAYAQAQKADAVVCHQDPEGGDDWGHVMMTVSVDVVYNEDGTINGDESVMVILEQTSSHVRKGIYHYDEELGENVYHFCGVDLPYTFKELYDQGYLPITCQELVDPATVEAPKVTDSLSASSYNYENLLAGSISTNHWSIGSVEITITDNLGNVAQQARLSCPRNARYKFSMSLFRTEKASMILGDVAPDALTPGNYHCKVVCRLSTEQEFVVRDFDFTVTTTKNDVHKTKLDFSAGTVHDCPACGAKAVQWNPLTSDYLGSGNGPAVGHYYLAESMTNNTTYFPLSGEGTYCLYLNGKDLKSSERVIYVGDSTTLNIMGEGTITGGATSSESRAGAIDNYGGTVNLYGGTYKHYKVSGKTTKSILGVRYHGTYNMYDGAVVQGTSGVVRSSILIYQGTFNMYGGKVENGYGTNGGNFLVGYSGTTYATNFLRIYGGEITNGNASNMGGNIYGIYDAIIYIYGGDILDGTAAKGGNLFLNKGANLRVYGGTLSGGTASEVGNELYGVNVENTLTGTILDDMRAQFSGTASIAGIMGAENMPLEFLGGAELISDGKATAWYGQLKDVAGNYDYLRFHQNMDIAEGDWKADLNGYTASLGKNATLEVTTDGQNFYPVELAVKTISLRTSAAGIYYTGAWNVTSLDVASFGVATSVADMPAADFLTDADTLYTVSAANGALIKNILSPDAKDNHLRGKTPIHGAAYVTLSDGSTVIGGKTASISLYDLVTYLEGSNNAKWKDQREAFIAKWADVFDLWERGVHLILNEDGSYGGSLNVSTYGKGAPLNGEYDVAGSDYYTVNNDFFNMSSTAERVVYPRFASYQQTMQDSSGLACVLMLLNYMGEDVYNKYTEHELLKMYEEVNGTTVYSKSTTEAGLINLIESLDLGYTATNEAPAYPDGFTKTNTAQFFTDAIKAGKFVLVRYQSPIGYGWKLVIGYDTLGNIKDTVTGEEKDLFSDDVIIFAEPNDGADHRQDGYATERAQDFFVWWDTTRAWGKTTGDFNYVIIDPNLDMTFDYQPVDETVKQKLYDLHMPLNPDGTYGGTRDAKLYGSITSGNGWWNHTESNYYKINDFYNMGTKGTRVLLTNYTVLQQTMSSSCGNCAINSILTYYGNESDPYDLELEYVKHYEAVNGVKIKGSGTTGTRHQAALTEWGYETELKVTSTRTKLPFPEYKDFFQYMHTNLVAGRPIAVATNFGSSHYLTVIGIDDMGTDYIYDDVIIVADSCDYWDGYQDGYNVYSAYKFYTQHTNGTRSQLQSSLVIFR